MGIRSPKDTSDSCNLDVMAADGVYWGVVDDVVIVVAGVENVVIDVVEEVEVGLLTPVMAIVVDVGVLV